MDKLTTAFLDVRKYVIEHLAMKIELFMTQPWNPIVKHVIIRETCNIINKEISNRFPDFPKKYYPQVRFKILDEEKHIEAGVQNYLNKETDLKFLGTNNIGSTAFDYYVRESWDLNFSYIFIARYGHTFQYEHRGSKTAEAEYYMGVITPLSTAYGIAIEDGFIS
jgi:hypothetical protein